MKGQNFRANSTDINKMPDRVRFVFIVENIFGKVNSCMTFKTLSMTDLKELVDVKVADIVEVKLHEIHRDMLTDLANEWRDNYFNPDWTIPPKYIK